MPGKIRTALTAAAAMAALGLIAPTMAAAGDSYLDPKPRPSDVGTADTEVPEAAEGMTLGVDVSAWQGSVNWQAEWDKGKRFAFIKATEGSTYQSPTFADQYNGSYNVGMIRGAYHFGRPDTTSGAEQADYFVDHGGGWSQDGQTLPGALDIEFSPVEGHNHCYNMSPEELVTWIRDFVDRYKERVGRDVIIYTSANWWGPCTNDNTKFTENPLWLANHGPRPLPVPVSWKVQTIWQYGNDPFDQNAFNGDEAALLAFANEEVAPQE